MARVKQMGPSRAEVDRMVDSVPRDGLAAPGPARETENPVAAGTGDGWGARSGHTDVALSVSPYPAYLAHVEVADRMALATYAPPGMLVDAEGKVLQLRGNTSGLLDPIPGMVSWKVAHVLRKDLVPAVLEALDRCVRSDVPASTFAHPLPASTLDRPHHIRVVPVHVAEAPVRCFLVSIQGAHASDPEEPAFPTDRAWVLPSSPSKAAEAAPDPTREYLLSVIRQQDERHRQMEVEVDLLGASLRASTDKHQLITHDLTEREGDVAALRRESRVFDELYRTQLHKADLLTDLLASATLPLLTLSKDLRVLHCTPAMQTLARPGTIEVGADFGSLPLPFQMAKVLPALREVLGTLTPCALEMQDLSSNWYLLDVRPYRTADDHIAGVVLIWKDIDQFRRNRGELMDSCDFLQATFESIPVPVVVARGDGKVQAANTAFRSLSRMRLPALAGRDLPGLLAQLWGVQGVREPLERLLTAGERFEFEHMSTTADRKALLLTGQQVRTGAAAAALLTVEDVTLRRESQALLDRERNSLETAVRSAALTLDRTQGELRSLTGHLFTVQEEERQRVARELHDDISQRLSFVEFLLKDASTPGNDAPQNEALDEVRKQVSALNSDVRTISHQLHPSILDDLGLSAALRSLVSDFARKEDMVATYISQDVPELARQPALSAIYRITQEALRNVAKHAGKTHVKVILGTENDRLKLQVVDLGMGFDQESALSITHGLGMISMKERAHLAHGSLSVRSALGYGTTVEAEIPFDAQT